MTFDEYTALAGATDSNAGDPLVVAALGLAGEAGEFADQVKKYVAQGHALDRDRLVDEAGDILWYVAKAARALGISLDEIAARNVAKLAARYPDGFAAQRSIGRDGE
ncbi:MAG: nucleoside triphosphate pyrophosphohydrolase family protein [Candidatus Limnocylindrales bacterium]